MWRIPKTWTCLRKTLRSSDTADDVFLLVFSNCMQLALIRRKQYGSYMLSVYSNCYFQMTYHYISSALMCLHTTFQKLVQMYFDDTSFVRYVSNLGHKISKLVKETVTYLHLYTYIGPYLAFVLYVIIINIHFYVEQVCYQPIDSMPMHRKIPVWYFITHL